MQVPEEQRKRLRELVDRSLERLKRSPSWITSGSQAEFDEWLLGGDRVAAIKRQAARESTHSL